MFVLAVRIFWGADTRTAGVQIVNLGYGYSLAPAALPPDRVDNTPRVAVPTFWNAGSHKTHCHGIAVEEFSCRLSRRERLQTRHFRGAKGDTSPYELASQWHNLLSQPPSGTRLRLPERKPCRSSVT